jgi:hypothetical protein
MKPPHYRLMYNYRVEIWRRFFDAELSYRHECKIPLQVQKCHQRIRLYVQ